MTNCSTQTLAKGMQPMDIVTSVEICSYCIAAADDEDNVRRPRRPRLLSRFQKIAVLEKIMSDSAETGMSVRHLILKLREKEHPVE
jgi:hypothetical protein